MRNRLIYCAFYNLDCILDKGRRASRLQPGERHGCDFGDLRHRLVIGKRLDLANGTGGVVVESFIEYVCIYGFFTDHIITAYRGAFILENYVITCAVMRMISLSMNGKSSCGHLNCVILCESELNTHRRI